VAANSTSFLAVVALRWPPHLRLDTTIAMLEMMRRITTVENLHLALRDTDASIARFPPGRRRAPIK